MLYQGADGLDRFSVSLASLESTSDQFRCCSRHSTKLMSRPPALIVVASFATIRTSTYTAHGPTLAVISDPRPFYANSPYGYLATSCTSLFAVILPLVCFCRSPRLVDHPLSTPSGPFAFRRFMGLRYALIAWGVGTGFAITLFMSPVPRFQSDILKKLPLARRLSLCISAFR